MSFSTPKPPPPPAPPPMPLDPTIIERRRRMRKQKQAGRLSTILTSPSGLGTRGSIAAPTLLGSSGQSSGY